MVVRVDAVRARLLELEEVIENLRLLRGQAEELADDRLEAGQAGVEPELECVLGIGAVQPLSMERQEGSRAIAAAAVEDDRTVGRVEGGP